MAQEYRIAILNYSPLALNLDRFGVWIPQVLHGMQITQWTRRMIATQDNEPRSPL